MVKIKLTNEEYNMMDDCRQYVYELLQRSTIELEDLEFIEKTLAMLESKCEHK